MHIGVLFHVFHCFMYAFVE